MTTTTEDLEDVLSEEITRNEIPLEREQIFSTDSASETTTSVRPQTETSAAGPEPAAGPQAPDSSPSSPGNGFSLDMLRMKIRELEGRPGGSPKIKGLLRKLKEAVDGPQGRQSTAAVYRGSIRSLEMFWAFGEIMNSINFALSIARTHA